MSRVLWATRTQSSVQYDIDDLEFQPWDTDSKQLILGCEDSSLSKFKIEFSFCSTNKMLRKSVHIIIKNQQAELHMANEIWIRGRYIWHQVTIMFGSGISLKSYINKQTLPKSRDMVPVSRPVDVSSWSRFETSRDHPCLDLMYSTEPSSSSHTLQASPTSR